MDKFVGFFLYKIYIFLNFKMYNNIKLFVN